MITVQNDFVKKYTNQNITRDITARLLMCVSLKTGEFSMNCSFFRFRPCKVSESLCINVLDH